MGCAWEAHTKKIMCDRKHWGSWERFSIHKRNGYVVIRNDQSWGSRNSRWCGVDSNGYFKCDRSRIDTQEKFKIQCWAHGDRVVLKSTWGRFRNKHCDVKYANDQDHRGGDGIYCDIPDYQN